MNHLVIHFSFIAYSYTGVRIREDRDEELDWPPSPGRVHEALLSAALLGVLRPADERAEVFAALRWLEELPAPEIWASTQNETQRTSPRIAIPQNNPKKGRLDSKSTLLAPTYKAVSVTGEALQVYYRWLLSAKTPIARHLEILSDAAARISYLGRSEDRVEVCLRIMDAPQSLPLVRWQPNPNGDAQLWVTKRGTTDGLEKRHNTQVPPRETRKPAQRWMRRVTYADDAPQSQLPIATAIFQIFPEDDDPDVHALSCGAETAGRWRELFRHQIVQLASEADNWDNFELAQELLTGHSAPGQRATRPHLAIVPLPSINTARTADGRVRRVALLGYAAPETHVEAVSIYETLFRALDDLIITTDSPLRRQGKPQPVRFRFTKPENDKVWSHYTRKSRVWSSILPVAIARGFKVPKFHPDGRELSSNERHRRKLSEWEQLLRQSLRHVGLPDELINACSIESTNTPIIPQSGRAEHYRAPGETAVLTHVRLEFPSQVRGPILIGDRRYFGLGLFVPDL